MRQRLFDTASAAFALAVLAFPLAVIALLVKFSSPGPVIYRQKRVGRGGKPFWLYKFRTMYLHDSGLEITPKGDSRITPVGHWLRRFKLDELPQLWNVMKGDMRVIGPRPEVERFVKYYTPEQRRVLDQTPGLAGYSQIIYSHEPELLEGFADPEEIYVRYLMPRKVEIDLNYESMRGFWSDLELIARVVLSILGKTSQIDEGIFLPHPQETHHSDVSVG